MRSHQAKAVKLMANYRFTSKIPQFLRKNDSLIDMVLGRMSADVERGIKSTAGTPVKTGGMKSSARHFRSTRGKFRVEVNKEYAAYQERGSRSDGTRKVRNYSTAGTSAGWFARAINNVIANKRSYIKEAARAHGL